MASMHLSYSIDPKAGIVTMEYTGDPTFEEWASTLDAVLHDPAFRQGYGILLDRSRLTKLAETEYIKRVAEYVLAHASQLGDSRVAQLVASGRGAYGMARMLQLLLGDLSDRVHAFTDREAALIWLRATRTS